MALERPKRQPDGQKDTMDAYSTPNIAQMQMVMGVATAIEAYPLVMLRTADEDNVEAAGWT